jgi:hypothetical protein
VIRTPRLGRLLAATAVGLAVAAAPAAAFAGSTSSAKIPFTDPNAKGSLTFCNRNDQPITSGSLYTRPFAWKTVASTTAPKAYRLSLGRVSLFAFQPIQYIDPGSWVGDDIIGASSYSNYRHPVDQATDDDLSLLGFVNSYPPHWDGLVQMRLFYSGVNLPEYSTTYPTAILKITGSTWTMVQGGGGSCTGGEGESNSVRFFGKSVNKHPVNSVPVGQPTPTDALVSAGQAGSSKKKPAAGSTAPTAQQSSVADALNGSSAGSSSGGLSTGAEVGIALGALLLLGAAGAAVAARRRPGTSD